LDPIRVVLPDRSVLNAAAPAAVAGGNVETSQRIVDVLLGALAPALPDRIPAASQGTMNNVAFGGDDWAYYETIAGGAGAAPDAPGLSGVHTHMTNTRNTPIEALSREVPVDVVAYRLRRGSGGAGRFPGGEGVVRRYRFRRPATLTILSERRTHRPWGLGGGGPGASGENLLRRAGGRDQDLGGKCVVEVAAGDEVEIQTPGGGGFGG
jgi:N-methylhydantoinase B